MYSKVLITFWIITVTNFIGLSYAQKKKIYDYTEAFKPFFYPQISSKTRSADGQPGPAYWQNSADYILNATLNDEKNEIIASTEITYTNNSPDQLNFLWLQLDQNVFNKESRYYAVNPSETVDPIEKPGGGYKIQTVKVDGKDAEYVISDTRMQIDLSKQLKGNGGIANIKIDYSFVCPKFGLDRMGVQQTAKGKIFAIGQWYPRICVYDDVSGWNTLPYLGVSEFYLGYGSIRANITVPADQYVVASGELLNEKQMYTREEIKRWKQAKNSDKTINIRSEAEFDKNTSSGTKTWKFKIENARDFAWASSSVFVIDAARINLSSGKKVLAVSAYPSESGGKDGWAKSVEYTKSVIEYNSQKWYDYVYPSATNVAATRGGMEYPGIVFCSWGAKGEDLQNITNHEFGHNWFPITVGSNERLFSWMDEGLNTYLIDLFTETFNKEISHKRKNIAQTGTVLMNDTLEPIMVGEDNMNIDHVGILAYHKPGIGLKILRELILGPEKFDKAFKAYIRYWAFKHPTPWDFFHTMENVSGEELNWFWRGWFFNNWKIDQSVQRVEYINGNSKNGALITVENLGQLPMPTTIQVKFKTGNIQIFKIPIEVWKKNTKWTVKVNSDKEIKEVKLDPTDQIPDINPKNNIWNSNQQSVRK
ncbi:hypothetical protein J2795_002045 [Chryseobacterium bernardetii]|uniref:Uncharacterized protein n=1 Tax=Chryseobacterium bernardetii TaxID=1241978 RepID=A0ACC6IU92_9FLAO|nr:MULTISPECIES: M1 family metallopeptidase [Chryseobacterium]MDR6370909.1 hypothetical protein [Chryseobacterium vietnamense]MDR6441345.1 hypothetical protein [Chryseobacterium bernardetii]